MTKGARGRSVTPTPERVARVLAFERQRLARLEADIEDARRRIAVLEAQAARLSDDRD